MRLPVVLRLVHTHAAASKQVEIMKNQQSKNQAYARSIVRTKDYGCYTASNPHRVREFKDCVVATFDSRHRRYKVICDIPRGRKFVDKRFDNTLAYYFEVCYKSGNVCGWVVFSEDLFAELKITSISYETVN